MYNAESQHARFIGSQFDVNRSPDYQEEVILVVRAKVTEKTFRTSGTGGTREISVLKPEDVYVPVGAQVEQLRQMFKIPGPDVIPNLGTPVQLELETFDENKEFGFLPSTDVEDFEDITILRPVSIAMSTSEPKRVPQTRDKLLAKFLSSVGED